MRAIFAVFLALLAVACGTTTNNAQPQNPAGAETVNLGKPEIQVAQISRLAAAARHVSGGVPVQYRIAVKNTSDQSITIERVSLQTLGGGAYDLQPTSNSFDVTVAPAGEGAVEMWAPANVSTPTIYGANGPVTLRATVFFKSGKGRFQEIVVQNVSGDGF